MRSFLQIFLKMFFFRSGSTPRESKRRVVTEDMVYYGPFQRFEQVFGPCGILHFLSPFLPFEDPKVDLGYRRIITYNSDYVVNGVAVQQADDFTTREEQMRLLDTQYDYE